MIATLDASALRGLDSSELHAITVSIAQADREVTEMLLRYLKEIERRRIYLDFPGVTSLHSYCTKILKYSEGAAARRVSAARMLGDLPDISAKIIEGSLNLSVLSTLKAYVKAEFDSNPAAGKQRATAQNAEQAIEGDEKVKPSWHPYAPRVPRVKYSVATKYALNRRSNGQCEWIDEFGERCSRRHHLQTDHKIPLYLGGLNDLENLQRICRPHNLLKGASAPRVVREHCLAYLV